MENNMNTIKISTEYKTTEEYLLHRVQILEKENEDLCNEIYKLRLRTKLNHINKYIVE